jgi:phosphoribosylformimino-5-aminoimidazole carboxamide ribotide isomerase
MKVYPSIDLMRGNVVRLRKGRASDVKVYSKDPIAVARDWSKTGISGIHVVDLDGAFGQGNNLNPIRRIIQATQMPVHVGGGIRTATIAHELVEAGADALVLGTVALTDEATFNRLVEIATVSRIIVALDYRGEDVLVAGWRQLSGITLDKALSHLAETGVQDFLLTCAERDGTMDGPDVGTIRRVCQRYHEARVFASGGVRSAADVVSLREAGAHAVIIGKAILDGTLLISEAIKAGAG